MAFIRRKGIWRPQVVPTFPVEVDRTHPLAHGLIGLWLPTAGGADLVGGVVLAQPAGGLSPITATSRGAAWMQQTGNTGLLAPAATAFTTGSTFALFWRGAILGNFVGNYNAPVVGVTYADTDTNPYVAYDIEITGGENIYGRVQNAQSASIQAGVGELSAGLTVGAFGLNFYRDGLFGSNAAAAAPLFSATSQVSIGCYPGDLGRSPNVATNLAAFYNASDDVSQAGGSELMAWLHAEPFGMLRPKIRRIYGFAPAPITASVPGTVGVVDLAIGMADAADMAIGSVGALDAASGSVGAADGQ